MTDGPSAGEISFSSSTYEVLESSSLATITVRRINGSDGAVSARCETSDGTATAGEDYLSTLDVLTWSDGETGNKTCLVLIIDDPLVEADETVNLMLTNALGGAGEGTSTAVLTILDDDGARIFSNGFESGDLCRWNQPATCGTILSFKSSTNEVAEDSGTAQITVERRQSSAGAVPVRCDTSPGTATTDDYTETMQVLNWADGETGDKICTVPITDDTLYEVAETVNLTLSNATGGATILGQAVAQLTILESDAIHLQLSSTTYEVDESIGIASIPVRRVGGTNGQVSVTCSSTDGTASGGADYTPVVQTLTWADGDTADKSCSVPIVNDSIGELDETLFLALSNATGPGAELGAPTIAVLTIHDDDATGGELDFDMPTYEFDENGGIATVLVTRSNGTSGIATVVCNPSNDTATAGSDYTATSDLLTWADEEGGTRACTIPITIDSIGEPDETINLALTNGWQMATTRR